MLFCENKTISTISFCILILIFSKVKESVTTHEVFIAMVMLFYTENNFSGKIEVSQVAVKRTRQPLACKLQI